MVEAIDIKRHFVNEALSFIKKIGPDNIVIKNSKINVSLDKINRESGSELIKAKKPDKYKEPNGTIIIEIKNDNFINIKLGLLKQQ